MDDMDVLELLYPDPFRESFKNCWVLLLDDYQHIMVFFGNILRQSNMAMNVPPSLDDIPINI